MSDYKPDKWVMVKIGDENLYKIFASWYGGWAGSDSWKLNSGVTQVSKTGYVYSFEGSSGSVYECHENTYGTNMYGRSVLNGMIESAAKEGVVVQILDEKTDFMNLTYE
jgi:hypothetical protein